MVKPVLEKESSSVEGVHGGKIEKAECTTSLNAAKVLNAVALDQVQLKTPRKRLTKYAILLGYQGKNYFGMQIQQNPNQPTIEFHLLNAMHKMGLITEEERKEQSKIFFQRAARTDRGVSAVRQVCSVQLLVDKPLKDESDQLVDNGPEKLNEHLPKDIRVLAFRRTTPTFHSQKSCDSRTYSYTLPTFAFAELDKLTNSSYRISEEKLKEIDDVLSIFKGTHNFFNYTSKKAHSDDSCKRYIISFKCDKPFLYKDPVRNTDVEFMSIYIKGQSFMMHQIRKMIGMTIAVIRGLAYKSDIQKSFEKQRMDIPKAPGLGLLLEQVHYERYDKKFGKTHALLDRWDDEVEANIRRLRDELIISEILRTECHNDSMMLWLTTLINHDFSCVPEDETEESKSRLRLAAKPKNEIDGSEIDLNCETEVDEPEIMEDDASTCINETNQEISTEKQAVA